MKRAKPPAIIDPGHTPGPWPVERHYDAPFRYVPFLTVGPARVNFSAGYDLPVDPVTRARAEADAQLISAAPVMLAALDSIIELVKGPLPWSTKDVNKHRASILSKAAAITALARTRLPEQPTLQPRRALTD